jgi:hypothetical protein
MKFTINMFENAIQTYKQINTLSIPHRSTKHYIVAAAKEFTVHMYDMHRC